VLSVTLFEPNGKLLKKLGRKAQNIVRQFAQSAAANGLGYRVFDSQATASWTAWEVLAAGVRGARSLDNERVCNYLKANGVDTTFVGKLRFNPAKNNFSKPRNLVKQIQKGRWKVVWPPALRVTKLQEPTR
jgi:branched-chain amino acid transport system substrate-binding protein